MFSLFNPDKRLQKECLAVVWCPVAVVVGSAVENAHRLARAMVSINCVCAWWAQGSQRVCSASKHAGRPYELYPALCIDHACFSLSHYSLSSSPLGFLVAGQFNPAPEKKLVICGSVYLCRYVYQAWLKVQPVRHLDTGTFCQLSSVWNQQFIEGETAMSY